MAENQEKEIPIKELEDGSIQAAYQLEEDPFETEEKVEKVEKAAKEEADDDEEDGDEPEQSADSADSDDSDASSDEETDDEREKIREARREERRLKKELQKQRDATARNKISALERRNEELAKRLAAIENTTASYQFVQLDKTIEDEATRVEFAKMKLMEAAQNQDAAAQVEYLEQLQDAKTRLAQAQAYKKQQLEQASQPKQNVPNPITAEVQQNATKWLKRNSWYDPQARDTDSRIAKVIDGELAADGWDPADPEYWAELDNRLSARLPHRYNKGEKKVKQPGPTASSRTVTPSGKSGNTITLSRDRVQAIKDAGAWDDPVRRNKMIKAYAQYDKQNRNS